MTKLILDNLHIKNNARKEEINAYLLLNEYLFKDKKVTIGDNVSIKEPDIFTDDHKIGLEVVTCELAEIYINAYHKSGAVEFYDETNYHSKTYQEQKKIRRSVSCKKNELNYYQSRKNNNDPDIINLEEKEYYQRMCIVLDDKLNRFNDGSYDSCQQKNLLVISDLSYKEFVNIDKITQIYNDIKKLYNKCFDNVFVLYNGNLYNISTNEEIDLTKKYNKLNSYNNNSLSETSI